MKVRFTETAEQDLLENLAYYRAPSAMGEQFNATVRLAVAHLRQWPFTGHRRRDLTTKDVCFWFEDPYMLAFQINGDTLSILVVLHGSRNIKPILRTRLKPKK